MSDKLPDLRAPRRDANVVRQIIFCAAALTIMGAGLWSLMNSQAPYHPDDYLGAGRDPNAVSRDGTNPWLEMSPAD